MNRFTLTCVLWFVLCNLRAQNYIPFPDSDAVWMTGVGLYNAYPDHPVATCDTPLSFGTDTTINGYTYHRLYGQTVCNWLNTYLSAPPPGTITNGTDHYPYRLQFTFRQDVPGRKVYLYTPAEEKDTLLYDFSNLVVGQPYPETFLNPAYWGLMVQSHDSILLEGNYHEIWNVGTNQYPNIVTVLEGIGSSQGFGTGFLFSHLGVPFESMYYLHCFTRNGNTLFSNWPGHFHYLPFPSVGVCGTDLAVQELTTNRLTVYPNPASEDLFIQSETPMESISITDMQGRIVMQRSNIGTTSITLSVASFGAGYYTIAMQGKNGNRSVTGFIKGS